MRCVLNADEVSNVVEFRGDCHFLINDELDKFSNSPTLEKHLRQQGHLIQLLW